MSNVGSAKPLYRLNISSIVPETKHTNWQTQARTIVSNGTPPTIISGGVNGRRTGLFPNIIAANIPAPGLFIKKSKCEEVKGIEDKLFEDKEDLEKKVEKALTRPTKGSSRNDKVGRKRDEHGKFSKDETSGTQSTAQEDMQQLKRTLRREGMKVNKKAKNWNTLKGYDKWAYRGKSSVKKSIGANPLVQERMSVQGDQNAHTNDNEPPIGQTNSGAPIYSDPYHQAHQSFGPEDHQMAAMFQDGAYSQQMEGGNTIQALGAQQKANIHRMLAEQARSPSERAFMRIMQQQGNDPMDNYMSGQGANTDPDMNKPAGPPDGEHQGPVPGMVNSFTQGAVGPQTDAGSFAGSEYAEQDTDDSFGPNGIDANISQNNVDPSDGASYDDFGGAEVTETEDSSPIPEQPQFDSDASEQVDEGETLSPESDDVDAAPSAFGDGSEEESNPDETEDESEEDSEEESEEDESDEDDEDDEEERFNKSMLALYKLIKSRK